jgi:hypothetical protein
MWVLKFLEVFGCLSLGGGWENICNVCIFQPFYDLNIIGNTNDMGIVRTWVICISIM